MKMCAKRRLALSGVAGFFVVCMAGAAMADPCLVVYPDAPCIYHYDTSEYYTVTMGHPLYDPAYDRGGEVLLEVGTNDIDLSIYQAPNLVGFTPSTGGQEGYFCNTMSFNLIVDGFSNAPTTYTNILIVFESIPSNCDAMVEVDGNPVSTHPTLGKYYAIGDLVVSTPTGEGGNYSDVITVAVDWQLCQGVQIWAFADEDFNYQRDGNECFSAFSHDVTVPVEATSWGAVKALYGDE